MKNIIVLGSTGSIGTQTLEVISSSLNDFNVTGLSASGNNPDLLVTQIEKFKPINVAVQQERVAEIINRKFKDIVNVFVGDEGNIKLIEETPSDIVVAAIVGTKGVYPVLKALELGKRVALANKEAMVVAGRFVKDIAMRNGGEVIPVDSEHSAIFQSLRSGNKKDVKKIILTASGGPFRDRRDLENVTIEEALKHPTWKMGKKITVDSATLFNKGLEVIEAKWLFDVPGEMIDVVIHPQSIVHSMVEFVDGSIIAQIGPPDMRIPISYALYYPDRWMNKFNNFSLIGKKLEFYKPDYKKFPALELAYQAIRNGDLSCFIYSQSNEIAVEAFLKGRISFIQIAKVVKQAMDRGKDFPPLTYNGIIKIEKLIRLMTEEIIKEMEKDR